MQSGGTKLFSYVSSCDKTSFQLCESLNFCTEKFPQIELCALYMYAKKIAEKIQSYREGK